MRKEFLFFSLLVLGGCAFHAQKASLNPTLDVASTVEGAGYTISLSVDDERASTSLGHRGNAFGAAAEITTDQDLTALVQEKIREGLIRKGYSVVGSGQKADRQLSVEIRDLKYSTSQGFWTGGIEVVGAMKVSAKSGDQSFDQIYRVDDKDRVVVVPGAKKNETLLNQALSELLSKVFNDVGLFRFLSQGK